MPDSIDSRGLQTKSLTELREEFEENVRRIYGQDVNLEASTPDGQLINILVQQNRDIREFIEKLFGNLNASTATGIFLDYHCQNIGITRKRGTYSTVNIDVVVDRGVSLAGLNQNPDSPYTVQDSNGNNWLLIDDSSLDIGSNVLRFRAENIGNVSAQPNTITTPVTIVIGVTSVNNSSILSSQGLNEESDLALRLRRDKSVNRSSQGFVDALEGELLALDGISDAIVCENTTDAEVDGIPAKGIWVVVDGPEDAVNIARAIYLHRSAGTPMRGSITHSYERPNTGGRTIDISWDLASQENVWVRFVSNRTDGRPISHAELGAEIANRFNVKIGQTLTPYSLICDIIQDESLILEDVVFFDRKTYRWTDNRPSGTVREDYRFRYRVGDTDYEVTFDGDESANDIIAKFHASPGLQNAEISGSPIVDGEKIVDLNIVIPDSVLLQTPIHYIGDVPSGSEEKRSVSSLGGIDVSGGLITTTSYKARDKSNRLVTSSDRVMSTGSPSVFGRGTTTSQTITEKRLTIMFGVSNIAYPAISYLTYTKNSLAYYSRPNVLVSSGNYDLALMTTTLADVYDQVRLRVIDVLGNEYTVDYNVAF